MPLSRFEQSTDVTNELGDISFLTFVNWSIILIVLPLTSDNCSVKVILNIQVLVFGLETIPWP